MKKLKWSAVLAVFFVFFYSCEKDQVDVKNDEPYNGEFLNYQIINYDVQVVDINKFNREIVVQFNSDIYEPDSAIAEFDITQGSYASINQIEQESGVTKNDLSNKIVYKLVDLDDNEYIEWSVLGCNNDYSKGWGLGMFLKQSVHLNRSYTWYIDQFSTGEFDFENCGPTSTTMAAKWSNENFNKSAGDARDTYRSSGGWWYTSDIDNYLSDNKIPHYYITLGKSEPSTKEIILDELNAGNIIILCVDMYYVTECLTQEYRIHKFYSTNSIGWGHFIVVKGYQYVDNTLFFEIYDPYSRGGKYLDESLLGKNRYYLSEDIYSATSNWWNYAICVSEFGKAVDHKAMNNISSIPVKWGGSY